MLTSYLCRYKLCDRFIPYLELLYLRELKWFPSWQKESWQTFEATCGYVRPEQVNKWPMMMMMKIICFRIVNYDYP